jgi:hypothetical protein
VNLTLDKIPTAARASDNGGEAFILLHFHIDPTSELCPPGNEIGTILLVAGLKAALSAVAPFEIGSAFELNRARVVCSVSSRHMQTAINCIKEALERFTLLDSCQIAWMDEGEPYYRIVHNPQQREFATLEQLSAELDARLARIAAGLKKKE